MGKKEDLSQLQLSAHSLRSSAPVHEDQVSHSPILESFILLGFLLVLVALGLNPMIFRVSRVSLDSINRLVNKEKTHVILEKNLRLLRKRFSGFILFPFILFYEDD